MLSCLVGKQNINTIDYDRLTLKKWSSKGVLKCPVCDGNLIYRHGSIRIPHFAHENDEDCDCGYWENETKEHALGKELLYKWIKQLPNVRNVFLEYWIPETKQRPDLYIEFKNGKSTAIEFQCSNISIDDISNRTELYKLNNMNVIWIFGNDKYQMKKSKASEKFCVEQFGDIYYLNPFHKTLFKNDLNNNHKMNNLNNFYVEKNQIKIDNEINSEFRQLLRGVLVKPIDTYEQKIRRIQRQRDIEELKIKQQLIYNAIMNEMEEDRKLRVIDDCHKLSKDMVVYIYNDYELYKKRHRQLQFEFNALRSAESGTTYSICESFIRNTSKNKFSDEIHLFIPNFDFASRINNRILQMCFYNFKLVKEVSK